MDKVLVWVVTYRRPVLLDRALRSLVAQSFNGWKGYVVNDDPEDQRVAEVIAGLSDSRISLHLPVRKRGAAGSFNLAFGSNNCEFAALLEDDNWWEPGFLEMMLARLDSHPSVDLAVGNERVWKETSNEWINTGCTVWPDGPDQLYSTPVDLACGSAKLCNSSMVVRRLGRIPFLTPDDIPVDVTEHFRERCITQPVLLVNEPLVNYAETLHTNRKRSGITWGAYQTLLIASNFCSMPPSKRAQLSHLLVAMESGRCTPRITALASTALFFREARMIWRCLSWKQRSRVLLTWIRRFPQLLRLRTFLASPQAGRHLSFLLQSPFNLRLQGNTTH
jgi:hypothetical protein